MKEKFKKVWELALPFLRAGKTKDRVIHTQGVVKAMELLLEEEKGDADILIPAAILHDVGWAMVSEQLQKSKEKGEKLVALKQHLEFAPPIIKQVLRECGYPEDKIQRITRVVLSHQLAEPAELEKRLLIDADTLSDAFKEQFYSDVKGYGTTPETNYAFRLKNAFYTKTANAIFWKEMGERKKEFSGR